MYDDDRRSGFLGNILGLLFIAIFWREILIFIGLAIAYVILLEIAKWVALHWVLVVVVLSGVTAIYLLIRFKLIHKTYQYCAQLIKERGQPINLGEGPLPEGLHYVPSKYLYCYQCAKKLRTKAVQLDARLYCFDCYDKTIQK